MGPKSLLQKRPWAHFNATWACFLFDESVNHATGIKTSSNNSQKFVRPM
jgi:hypothetical protein